MELRVAAGLDTGRAGTPGKAGVGELERGASQGASEVVVGLSVAARKAGAAEAEDCLDLRGRCAAPQQLFGDPEVDDTPIGLRETLRDAQTLQKALIDSGRSSGLDGGADRFGRGWCGERRREEFVEPALGCRHEMAAIGSQLRLGVHESDP